MTLRTVAYVGHEEALGSDFWFGSPLRQAAAGSVEFSKHVEDAFAELRPKVQEALRVFAEKLE